MLRIETASDSEALWPRCKYLRQAKKRLTEVEGFKFGRMIGSGVFSRVYIDAANPFKVIKLTTCELGNFFLENIAASLNPHFPKGLEYFGVAGRTHLIRSVTCEYDLPIHVWKIERLYDTNYLSKEDVSLVERFKAASSSYDWEDRPAGLRDVKRKLQSMPGTASVIDAICELQDIHDRAEFKFGERAALDMHMYNFMCRKSDRTLVITDPLVDRSVVSHSFGDLA